MELTNAQEVIRSHSVTMEAQKTAFEKYEAAINKLQNAVRDSDNEIDGKNRRLVQLGSMQTNLETQVMLCESEKKRLCNEVEHWKELASQAGGAASSEMIERLDTIKKGTS